VSVYQILSVIVDVEFREQTEYETSEQQPIGIRTIADDIDSYKSYTTVS